MATKNPNYPNLNILTSEEARVYGSMGGKRSVETRSLKKSWRNTLVEALEETLTVTSKGKSPRKVTKLEIACVKLVNDMIDTQTRPAERVRIAELVRDTVGEKPIDKVEMSTISQEDIDDMRKFIDENINNKE